MEKRVKNIVQILDDKKAENIEIFDLKNNDYMVDYVVVATTLNAKHGASLLTFLKEGLKPQKEEFFEDSGFYKYHEAYHLLKFPNEKLILEKAYNEYLELKKRNLWGNRKYF